MLPNRIRVWVSFAFILAFLFEFWRPVLPAQAASPQAELHPSVLRLSKTVEIQELNELKRAGPDQEAGLAGPSQPFAPTVVAPCKLKIMPLGDSITKGSSSGVLPDDPGLYVSYRQVLWTGLKDAGYSDISNVNSIIDFVGSQTWGSSASPAFDSDNEGWGGYRDDQIAFNIYDNGGLNWLAQNPANSPDIIMLHIGTNAVDYSAADVENILDEVDQFEADNHTQVWVVLARIVNRSCSPDDKICLGYVATTTVYNDKVEAMAQARIANGDKIILVDMETIPGFNYNLYSAGGDMYDDKHPYSSGYSKMANVWKEALLEQRLPFARYDSLTVNEDSSNIPPIDVLANDCGKSPILTAYTQGTNGGAVSPGTDGKLNYQPAQDYYGTETFTYTIKDNASETDGTTAVVTVTVNPVNDAVTAVDDTINASEDTPLTSLEAVLTANDSRGPGNESGQTLTIEQVNGGANTHGNLDLNSGSLTFTPEENYNGPASFEYQICDDGSPQSCETASVNLNIAAVNDLPAISGLPDQKTTLEDTPTGEIAFTIGDVETGPAGLVLSGSSSDPAVVPPGNIVFGGSGSSRTVEITPAPDKNTGSSGVTITLKVKDADNGEASVTMKLVITPVDDPPLITNPGDQSILLNRAFSLPVQATDPDQKPDEHLVYSATNLPPGLSINPDTGLISGTPTILGGYAVDLVVRNGAKVATASFMVTVTRYRFVYLPTLIKPPDQSLFLVSDRTAYNSTSAPEYTGVIR